MVWPTRPLESISANLDQAMNKNKQTNKKKKTTQKTHRPYSSLDLTDPNFAFGSIFKLCSQKFNFYVKFDTKVEKRGSLGVDWVKNLSVDIKCLSIDPLFYADPTPNDPLFFIIPLLFFLLSFFPFFFLVCFILIFGFFGFPFHTEWNSKMDFPLAQIWSLSKSQRTPKMSCIGNCINKLWLRSENLYFAQRISIWRTEFQNGFSFCMDVKLIK